MKKKISVSACIVFFLFLSACSTGAGITDFRSICFGGSGNDNATALVPCSTGFMITGSSGSCDGDLRENKGGIDALLAALSPSGDLKWIITCGGGMNDELLGGVELSGGLFCAVGETASTDFVTAENHGGTDILIISVTLDGTLVSSHKYGGAGNDRYIACCAYGDGTLGVLLVTEYLAPDGNFHRAPQLLKLDSHGLLISAIDLPSDIAAATMGFFDPKEESLSILVNTGDGTCSVYRIGIGDGSVISVAHITLSRQIVVFGFKPLNDGYVLLGQIDTETDLTNCWIKAFDGKGSELWENSFGGSGRENLRTLTLLGNGMIVAGDSSSTDIPMVRNLGGNDFYIALLNNRKHGSLSGSGSLSFQQCFGGSDFDTLTSIQTGKDGRVFLLGNTCSRDGNVVGYHALSTGFSRNDIWLVSFRLQ